jgi:NAD(P)-dependent dehydrogenase (short-subunit alcohol dehydrogenase family)
MSKSIVVVGASRGIGKAVVELFASNSNCKVFALARNKERLISNFKEFPNVVCGAFDLTSPVGGQLAEIFENLAAIRKKYKTVNVPFGQIDLNWDELESKSVQIKQSIQEKLDATPPDHLIHIF